MAGQYTLEEATAQRTSKKRNFTRQFNNAGKITAFATANPSPAAATECKEVKERLTKAYEELMNICDTLITIDQGNAAEQEGVKDDTQDRYETMIERIIATVTAINRPTPGAARAAGAAANPAPAPGAQANSKLADALKPGVLTADFNPVEFKSWSTKFRSYYRTGRMNLLEVEDQQALWRVCIDPNLEIKMAPFIAPDTPIFGNGGCMDMLTQEFEENYPLDTRRSDYFTKRQKEGQKFSVHAAEIMKLAAEADLAALTVDELHCFRYISSCTDKKLRDKLLKVEKPTLNELNRVVKTYERVNATCSALDGGRQTYNQAQVKQVKNKQEVKVAKSTPIKDGKPRQCYACGASDHLRNVCPKKEENCKFCGRRGHQEAVCRTKQWKAKQDQQGPTTAKAKCVKTEINEDESSEEEAEEAQTSRVYHRISQIRQYTRDTPRLRVEVRAANQTFKFKALPDTGATRSIMSLDIASKHNLTPKPTSERLFAADDSRLRCEGTVKARIDGVKMDLLVSSSIKQEIIICWHDLVALNVLPANFPRRQARVAKILPDNNYQTAQTKVEDTLESLYREYEDILTDELPPNPMHGEPMHIELDESKRIIPKKVENCRRVPVHWENEADRLIAQLVADDVIEEVHEDTTDWVSPAFFVPKDNGKLRLVTDFTRLNLYIKRPIHPFPSASDIMQRIPVGAQWFAKLDALQGYHQVPLAEESRHLTTFLIPQGKFRYKRGPMGLRSTNDVYCAKSDKSIKNIPDTQKIVDDIFVCAQTKPELFQKMRRVLDNCSKLNIAISKRKLTFGRSIDFAGFTVSADGVLPDKAKVAAIADFPVPTSVTELRSFLGLANQLGGFIENLAILSEPLRGLLKKGVAFTWRENHQKAFEQMRKELSSPALVGFFDPNLPTVLLSDASNLHGLGFALMQKTIDGKQKLIQCGSRSLTDTETRYAPVELECLGITWAVEKCSHFLLGNPSFTIITDHMPLKGIFQKDIHMIANRRLQRFRERLMPYVFNLDWSAGKAHLIADAFSRRPVRAPLPSEEDNHTVRYIAAFDKSLKDHIMAAAEEQGYRELISAIKERKEVNNLPPEDKRRSYTASWAYLSLSKDEKLVIYDGSKVVIPQGARKEVLKFLHQGHCGFIKTKRLAQELYHWPQMTTDIRQLAETCEACQELAPSQQREPLKPSKASFPMEMVGIDLFQWAGIHYLCMVDKFSGYPFVHKLRSLTTSAVTKQLTAWFWDFGFPEIIRSDGGPQFRSEFEAFCKANGIQKEISSPYNPQSNGLAESAVKQTKFLIRKTGSSEDKFRPALLAWRNTPRADGVSPSQMFYGYTQLFGQMTVGKREFLNREKAHKDRELTATKVKDDFDEKSTELTELTVGQRVLCQNVKTKLWDIKGTISDCRPTLRSYHIACDDGSSILRNRKYIRELKGGRAVKMDD